MNETLYHLVLERLVGDEKLDGLVVELVDGACRGAEALSKALDAPSPSSSPKPPVPAKAAKPIEPPGAYLHSIEVAGFRGISEAATLQLNPGPGLTLVLGRNGSGKSTLAEGLETLLTGKSGRWESRRQKAWSEGWKNLHTKGGAHLEATFFTEGSKPVVVRRTWNEAAVLEDSKVTVRQGPKILDAGLSALGWDKALDDFRPFLSYTELGTLLFEEPSKLYNSLANMLGLGDVADARNRLSERRKRLENAKNDVKDTLKSLLPQLEALDDPRAKVCFAALSGKKWQLEAVEEAVLGQGDGAESSTLETLRKLSQLQPLDVARLDEAREALRKALQHAAELANTDAAKSDRLAKLLQSAHEFWAQYEGDCPVCSAPLAADWSSRTLSAIEEARALATEVKAAYAARDAAQRMLRSLLRPVPPILHKALELGLGAQVLALWQAWADVPNDPIALLEHVSSKALVLDEALGALLLEARTRLAEMEDLWRPLAEALAAWLQPARMVVASAPTLKALKAAESWLKEAEAELRDSRFEPIAERAQHIWSLLRHQSNVDLAKVKLKGDKTRRHVELNVTVDGENTVALSVMSQGELNALALSLFLPRMTLAESPFRFLIIDDPVQAMDPAKVDGLARILEEEAKHRQVVVFTHDARLQEAVKRLQIDASIVQVSRRSHSVIDLQTTHDPVESYFSDAFAIAKSEQEMGLKVVQRLVPGFCRSALEVAALETVRWRRLGRGDEHADVAEAIDGVEKLQNLAAFALFDDPNKGGEVFSKLNQRLGGWAVEAFKACKEGAHGGWEGSAEQLIKDARKIADLLRSLP